MNAYDARAAHGNCGVRSTIDTGRSEGIPVETVVATLGEAGWRKFNDEAARRIASGLDTLFAPSE